MRKLISISSLVCILFLVLAPVVFAAGPGGEGNSSSGPGGEGDSSGSKISVTLTNPFKTGDNLYDLAKDILRNVIMPLAGILCVLAFIYAGFMYVMAQGKPAELAKANKMLLYAAIGSALLLGAEAITFAVETTVKALK